MISTGSVNSRKCYGDIRAKEWLIWTKIIIHKFNVQIHRFEDVLRNSRRNEPPNRWSYHRIGLLTEGGGDVKTGIFSYKAKKNTLVVVPSRVISSSSNWAPDTTGYVLLFNMDFFLENNFSHQIIGNKRMLTPSVQPYIHLTDEHAEEVCRIFESILAEKKQQEMVNNEMDRNKNSRATDTWRTVI